MKRAQLFANNFRADCGDVLHIYDDGFVLMIACSTDRHKIIREALKTKYLKVEDGRSNDGFQSAFVIPVDLSDTVELVEIEDDIAIESPLTVDQLSGKHPLPFAYISHYADHRFSDAWLLEHGVKMAKWAAGQFT